MMKSFFYITLALVALISCSKEPSASVGEGTLSIESIDFQGPVAQVISTRAVDPLLAVDILSSDGSVLEHYATGASVPSKLVLPVGEYTLHCYSENIGSWASDNGGRGSAAFEFSTPFSIETDYITYLTVKVPMINIGLKVSFPEGFSQWFPTAQFTVTSGTGSIVLGPQNSELYFPAGTGTLSYRLHVENTDGEAFDMPQGQITEPKVGTVYSIEYRFVSPKTSRSSEVGMDNLTIFVGEIR